MSDSQHVLNPLEQAARLREEQQRSWAEGRRVLIETYLERHPELQSDAEAVMDLIYGEVVLRERVGETPGEGEYLARFPALAEPIRRQFALHRLLESDWDASEDKDGSLATTVLQPTPPGPADLPNGEGQTGHQSPDQAEAAARASLAGRDAPTVAGYEILGELGRGGMGVVYKARHLALNRVVALKMILAGAHAHEGELARFKAEAEAVARLQHPNIVQIYEIAEEHKPPYFSLEFCDGGSLEKKLASTPQPGRDAAELVETLARAMHVAHQKGIIHRDLKPANVLLAGAVPKITDFGLAKKLDEPGQTLSGAIMGTPSYMAPEQAQGRVKEIGPATDVYALGAILYQCLTGRSPFKAATVHQTLDQVVKTDPVPPTRLNPGCPRDLETICLKCLQKKPIDRYGSAQMLADDLRRYLHGEPILARPAGVAERVLKWARRSPYQAVALASGAGFLVALLAALVAGWYYASTEANLTARKFEDQQRILTLSEEFTRAFTTADSLARTARPGEADNWKAVETALREPLARIKDDPAFRGFPLLQPAQDLLARAEGEQADARVKTTQRERLREFKEYHGDAVFFGSLSVGLELPDSVARTRQAVAQGLAVFNVTADNSGPPLVDPRFFSAKEAKDIAERCYELLLLDAEVLARPIVGEKVEAWRQRLRQALALLNRAEQLQLPAPVRSGLVRRAEYLTGLDQKEEAKKWQQLADETPPKLAVDDYLIGLQHFRQGDYEAAVKSLADALKHQPEHYGAKYLAAVCLLRARQWQAAKLAFTECLRQRSDFLWPLLLRGYASMELGEFGAAIADYDEVISRLSDPSARYVALVNRGALAIRRKQWDAAADDLGEAIRLKPEAVAAYMNLALVYRLRWDAQPEEAVLALGTPGPFALLAVKAARRQALSEAVALLDNAIQKQPRSAWLYHERAELYRQLGDALRARDDYARAALVATSPGGSSTLAEDLIQLGQLLAEGRQYNQALEVYRAVLKVRPDQAIVHRLMADALLKQKHYPEAGEALDRYLQTIPIAAPGRPLKPEEEKALARALRVRGIIYVHQKDFRGALDSYTQALKLQRDAETLALRGWAYLTFDAPVLALADFTEAITLTPKDAGDSDAWLGRAEARIKLGRLNEALADAEEGLKRGPAAARTYYNAARVYAQAAGRVADFRAARYEQKAIELLTRALAATPLEDRPGFWQDYVQADAAFNAIRRGEAMTQLAAQLRK